jgi:hypothetical protein
LLSVVAQILLLWFSLCAGEELFPLSGDADEGVSGVREYLVGYILCIISCHICRDIFGRIDIMYCKLPYVSRSVLPLKTLVLYIYWPRDNAIQSTIIHNLFFLHSNQSLGFFLSSKSSAVFIHAAPGEIDLDSTGGHAPG